MKKVKITSIAGFCLLSSMSFASDLSDALISTYQTNPELIAAREKLKITDEQMYNAISGFLPRIYYQGRKTYQKDDTNTSITSIQDTSQVSYNKVTPWDYNKRINSDINLQQNLFSGGQSVMAVRIAKFTIDAAREELISTEQSVFQKAISAFAGVIYAKQVLEINKENVVAYEKRYEAIKERVIEGVDKQADLAKVSAGKADAYTNLTIASGSYENSLATYQQVIGLEANDLQLGVDLGEIPKTQLELLNKSLVTNPALKNVTSQYKAAEINVYSNAAALLPSVDIGGSIGKSWQKENNASNQPYTNSKTAYIQVTVPIFNQGIEYSRTREASARAATLKYSVKNTKSTVTQEASRAWNTYIGAVEALKSAKEAVSAAEIALSAIQQSYDEGVDKLIDLLDAQQDLYSYRVKLARVQNELVIARYDLLALVGTLNAKDLSLSTKLYNPAANYDKVKFELIGF